MGQGLRAAVRGLACVALALSVALPGIASAQDDEPLPTWYGGPLAGYFFPDAKRDADKGINVGGILGVVLADSVSLELNAFGTKVDRTSGGKDAINGAALDLTLGTPAPGNPIFMLGGGAVSQELAGVKKTDTFGELGLGVYLPFSFFGELWRIEGRYSMIFNNHPTLAGVNNVEDGRINLGVMFPFGRQEAEPLPAAVAAAAPDSDGDGIPDDRDQCPDSPKWARVDANGCVPDADGDGVDDARDECPASPAGAPVDARGCPVKQAEPAPLAPQQVAQAPVAAPVGDEDKDGVNDADDKCPHTTPGMAVDADGCVKPEDVSMRNVHFDVDSARLTADGYTLLRQLAATLTAQPDLKLQVDGHADASGGDKHNQKLSRARAQVVRDFLVYCGVPADQLTVKAFGELAPVRDNLNAENKSYNRRVEFKRVAN